MKIMNLALFVVIAALAAAPVVASTLSVAQQNYIDQWLERNGLNEFGDPLGTVYLGGSPLFNPVSGETKDRYEYVLERHPRLVEEIQHVVGLKPVSRGGWGFAPPVFAEDVQAALNSNDYLRVGELVYGLRQQGPTALQSEAEALKELTRQLRFRYINATCDNEARDIAFAMTYVDPAVKDLGA